MFQRWEQGLESRPCRNFPSFVVTTDPTERYLSPNQRVSSELFGQIRKVYSRITGWEHEKILVGVCEERICSAARGKL
jgi:hypothetical protein